jgi:hypothetical protein
MTCIARNTLLLRYLRGAHEATQLQLRQLLTRQRSLTKTLGNGVTRRLHTPIIAGMHVEHGTGPHPT